LRCTVSGSPLKHTQDSHFALNLHEIRIDSEVPTTVKSFHTIVTSGGASSGISTTCSEAWEVELDMLLPKSGSSSMYDCNLLEGCEVSDGPPSELLCGRCAIDHCEAACRSTGSETRTSSPLVRELTSHEGAEIFWRFAPTTSLGTADKTEARCSVRRCRGSLCFDLGYREIFSCKQVKLRAKGGLLMHTPDQVLLTSAQRAKSCRKLRNYVSVRGDFRQ